ncbi:hypothetical protein VKT23_018786 [Stygiomarasmius scandens]|uniref:Uncharacterized protein n=1 Tax=Marasmiellus scandens TaxID=2682957 RepID=A0ABR1IQF1_9AGAR
MKAHPQLLKLSLFALQCIDYAVQRTSPTSPVSSTLGDESSLFALTPRDSDAAVVSNYAVSEYERTTYYNGITDDGDHPDLLYRSDFLENPFPKPKGRHAHLPSKSVQGVYNTSLNKVWDTVGPQIRDLVKNHKVRYSSIDPARFVTYGEDDTETLGPVVIWVGVYPGSTSPDTAHEVSQDILALLVKNGVEGAVVEWREAVPSKLAGPALMRVTGNHNPTAHVRRIFTAALNVPLAAEERENEDAQGSLTLYFHEGKDEHGNSSDKVLGVSSCHVLRKNTDVDYEFKGPGAPRQYVRVGGLRRFQQGLDDIKALIGDHGILADLLTREIVQLEAKENLDKENTRELQKTREKLHEQQEAIAELEAFYNEVKNQWGDAGLRNIGHVRYAKAISVDVEGGTLHTEDWGAFEVDKAKVKPEFEGTFVDLGLAIAPEKVVAMFYPQKFKYPEGRKLKIQGVLTPELLANPDLHDSKGQPCLIVGKHGTKTGLTFGCYAGLVSFLCNEVGVESIELGIYNCGKNAVAFSDKGDSGALVWDSLGRIFGQIHSGQSKGGLTSSHITYATPGWWLLQRIKARFPHVVFYRDTWAV